MEKTPATFVKNHWVTELLTERCVDRIHTCKISSWHLACPLLNLVLECKCNKIHLIGENSNLTQAMWQRHLKVELYLSSFPWYRKVHQTEADWMWNSWCLTFTTISCAVFTVCGYVMLVLDNRNQTMYEGFLK